MNGLPVIDDKSLKLLEGLHPLLIEKITRVLQVMLINGTPMKVIQGLRTAEYQHTLWLQGRNEKFPGKIVTNCDGFIKKSRHQAAADGFGHAVDCAFLGTDPFNLKHPWKHFGGAVRAEKLTWGGDFQLVDLDHAELP